MRFFGALLFAVVCISGCGYRPVAGGMGPEIAKGARFAPFLVRNSSPDLSMSHVVGVAARQELGRRGLLAPADTDADGLYHVELTILRFSNRPASLTPKGTVLEYFGEMHISHRIYAPGSDEPILVTPFERLWYRYYFNANPQVLEQFRSAAVADSIRRWIPSLVLRTSLAQGQRERNTFTAVQPTEWEAQGREDDADSVWEEP